MSLYHDHTPSIKHRAFGAQSQSPSCESFFLTLERSCSETLPSGGTSFTLPPTSGSPGPTGTTPALRSPQTGSPTHGPGQQLPTEGRFSPRRWPLSLCSEDPALPGQEGPSAWCHVAPARPPRPLLLGRAGGRAEVGVTVGSSVLWPGFGAPTAQVTGWVLQVREEQDQARRDREKGPCGDSGVDRETGGAGGLLTTRPPCPRLPLILSSSSSSFPRLQLRSRVCPPEYGESQGRRRSLSGPQSRHGVLRVTLRTSSGAARSGQPLADGVVRAAVKTAGSPDPAWAGQGSGSAAGASAAPAAPPPAPRQPWFPEPGGLGLRVLSRSRGNGFARESRSKHLKVLSAPRPPAPGCTGGGLTGTPCSCLQVSHLSAQSDLLTV